MVRLLEKRLFSFFILSIALVACLKEPSLDPTGQRSPPGQQGPRLIKKLTTRYHHSVLSKTAPYADQVITYRDIPFYFLSRVQSSYQYDAQKRLIRQEVAPPGSSDPIEYFGASYEYTDNKMIYTHLRSQQSSTYLLNQQGYILENNTYDSDGYLIRRQPAPGVLETQTVSEGNVVKQVYQDQIRRATTTYEYDLTKNGFTNPDDTFPRGFPRMGRNNRNLLVKATQVNESFTGVPSGNRERFTTTYTYEFDQQGLVKQETAYLEGSFMSDPKIVDRVLQISIFEFEQ